RRPPPCTSSLARGAPACGIRQEPWCAEEAAPAAIARSAPAPRAADFPMGTIQVTPEKQQLIVVRYGMAEMTTSAGTLRALGKVAFDETRLTRIHSKVEGWIEKVHVDFMGASVTAGQPLLTIYRPEMLASEQKF